MQITRLFKEHNKLQRIHGDKGLNAIYGCGQTQSPDICLVFMNPTAKNVSADKNWKGIRAPWLGTKNVWNMLTDIGLFDKKLNEDIQGRHSSEWDEEFSKRVYKQVKKNSIYITNLSKATQEDAKPLPNKIFKEYLDLLKEEIGEIDPRVIITFGNQVSSIVLGKNIKISEYRKKNEILDIKGKKHKVFPVYYPVGQGMMNINLAKDDIKWIMKNELKTGLHKD